MRRAESVRLFRHAWAITAGILWGAVATFLLFTAVFVAGGLVIYVGLFFCFPERVARDVFTTAWISGGSALLVFIVSCAMLLDARGEKDEHTS